MTHCKRCQSAHTVLAGRARAKQRYQCKDCSYHFVKGDWRKEKHLDKRKIALHLCLENMGLRAIGRVSKTGHIRTDGWTGYAPLKEAFPNWAQEKSGENFHHTHRAIMMLKAWLRGVHHSVRNLQAYIDAYTYRFNRSFMKEGIFDNLMGKVAAHEPCPYSKICMY